MFTIVKKSVQTAVLVAGCTTMAPMLVMHAGSESRGKRQDLVTVENIGKNLYCAFDKKGTGNATFYIHDNGVLLVDTKMPDLANDLYNAISQLSSKPITQVVNTHLHTDHMENNPFFKHNGAQIIAHENVLKRLRSGYFLDLMKVQVPPAGPEALPSATFTNEHVLHFGSENVRIIHLQNNGHTDGDSIVHFEKANVVATGDLVFLGMFPYINLSIGGSAKAMIESINKLLPLIDEKTVIVPGHGPVCRKSDLVKYQAMLSEVIHKVAAMKKEGKSLEAVLANNPAKAFEKGMNTSLITVEGFCTLVYNSLE